MRCFDLTEFRRDPKTLYIKKNILEPNRLLYSLSPKNFKNESKDSPVEKIASSPSTTYSSPRAVKTPHCAKEINKIYKGMLRNRLKKQNERIEDPLASFCVSKRPWGEHIGYSGLIMIDRKDGLPTIFTADKLKGIKKKCK